MKKKRLLIGVVRYASVANAIGDALGTDPPPDCRIGAGRIVLTFRSLGATRWSENRQIEEAHRIAAVTRQVLLEDRRPTITARASNRAVVVVYEDAADVRGCSVVARWECVIPAPAPERG